MSTFDKGAKVAIFVRRDDRECQGIVIQSSDTRSLVDFPAAKASGADRERVWIENSRLVTR